MLRVFTEYRRAAALGVCATVAVTALFLAMGEGAFAIFIVILGLWITWLVSLYQAIRAHQRLLDILYQDMDARRFMQEYGGRLPSARRGSAFEAAMRAHMGNACVLLGEYDKALEWFASPCEKPEVRLLMAENRAACLQRMKSSELPAAVEAWKRELEGVKPARRRLSEQSLRLLDIRTAVEEGRADERMQAEVQENARASNKRSYRASMKLLLARIYIQRGFLKAAKGELEDLAALQAQTRELQEAREMLKEWSRREEVRV